MSLYRKELYESLNGQHRAVPIKNMIDELENYKNKVKKGDCAALFNAYKKSAFDLFEWIIFAIYNKHYQQLTYLVRQGIIKPFEILEGLILQPHIPLSPEIVATMLETLSKDKRDQLMKLAKEHMNKTFGHELFVYEKNLRYWMSWCVSKDGKVLKKRLPSEIGQKILSYV